MFQGTRQNALQQFHNFLPRTAEYYTRLRNFDYGPRNRTNTSCLSPYIRRRLISEQEVCRGVLERFQFNEAEKFLQEVFWRTYWKGWLEMRPEVWSDYRYDLKEAQTELPSNKKLLLAYQQACNAQTGIDAFDFWVQELKTTGYLHNHARMWFASIWIFTLRLPWVLGADLFYRELLDADPASNTLSWRWVGGLHTKGKAYSASCQNIRKFTESRFEPTKLEENIKPLEITKNYEPRELLRRPVDSKQVDPEYDLLVCSEDLSPEIGELSELRPKKIWLLQNAFVNQHEKQSPQVSAFEKQAFEDTISRLEQHFNQAVRFVTAQELLSEKKAKLLGFWPSVGPYQDFYNELEQNHICQFFRRSWDERFYPFAKKGFFQFKKQLPKIQDIVFSGETPD